LKTVTDAGGTTSVGTAVLRIDTTTLELVAQ
jgi:hypothetical protein